METLRPVLRAAAVTAFAVGLLIFLINPPELDGLASLGATLAAAGLLILLRGWATGGLWGRVGGFPAVFGFWGGLFFLYTSKLGRVAWA
jgi:hypothetical protein